MTGETKSMDQQGCLLLWGDKATFRLFSWLSEVVGVCLVKAGRTSRRRHYSPSLGPTCWFSSSVISET